MDFFSRSEPEKSGWGRDQLIVKIDLYSSIYGTFEACSMEDFADYFMLISGKKFNPMASNFGRQQPSVVYLGFFFPFCKVLTPDDS